MTPIGAFRDPFARRGSYSSGGSPTRNIDSPRKREDMKIRAVMDNIVQKVFHLQQIQNWESFSFRNAILFQEESLVIVRFISS